MEDLGGAIRVEGKEDGSSGDVEVLKSEVQRNKDALMQTAMRLHDVVKEVRCFGLSSSMVLLSALFLAGGKRS